MIVDPQSGHQILFIEVPDLTPGKNRLHFDLRPREGTRDEEVERLLGVGATVVADRRDPDGRGGWVTMADPEGRSVGSSSSPIRRFNVQSALSSVRNGHSELRRVGSAFWWARWGVLVGGVRS